MLSLPSSYPSPYNDFRAIYPFGSESVKGPHDFIQLSGCPRIIILADWNETNKLSVLITEVWKILSSFFSIELNVVETFRIYAEIGHP